MKFKETEMGIILEGTDKEKAMFCLENARQLRRQAEQILDELEHMPQGKEWNKCLDESVDLCYAAERAYSAAYAFLSTSMGKKSATDVLRREIGTNYDILKAMKDKDFYKQWFVTEICFGRKTNKARQETNLPGHCRK